MPVAHDCNLIYSGVRDQEDQEDLDHDSGAQISRTTVRSHSRQIVHKTSIPKIINTDTAKAVLREKFVAICA